MATELVRGRKGIHSILCHILYKQICISMLLRLPTGIFDCVTI